MKVLIMILLLVVLLVGCSIGSRNVSRTFCNEMLNTNRNENISVRYEVGSRCVLEEKGYTDIIDLQCKQDNDYILLHGKFDIDKIRLKDCEVIDE